MTAVDRWCPRRKEHAGGTTVVPSPSRALHPSGFLVLAALLVAVVGVQGGARAIAEHEAGGTLHADGAAWMISGGGGRR